VVDGMRVMISEGEDAAELAFILSASVSYVNFGFVFSHAS